MIPNFVKFQKEESFGDWQVLRQGLDTVWAWIESAVLPIEHRKIVADCEMQAPYTGDYGSMYTSAALDASAALVATLESLRVANVDRALEVASYAMDTIELFLQRAEDLDPLLPSFERSLFEHPLMQSELKIQVESIDMLAAIGAGRYEVAKAMSNKWTHLLEGSLPQWPR